MRIPPKAVKRQIRTRLPADADVSGPIEPGPAPEETATMPAVASPVSPASQAAGRSLPVLEAFQEFLEEERRRTRNRILILSAVFLIVLLTVAPSHTKGVITELIVSPEYLGSGERVLIIDDFLASGATIMGLVRLAQTAGATIVGIGTLIEKSFEGGRAALAPLGVPVESLAVITSMDGDKIIFDE